MNTIGTIGFRVALLVATAASTFAQSSWETVDEVPSGLGCSVFADSNGNFLSFANDFTSTSNFMSEVSISSDRGLTWQAVCQIPMRLLRPAQGADGTLYAAGSFGGPMTSSVPHAIVWQSLDHGLSWTQLSDPWFGPGLAAQALGVGASDVVYLAAMTSLSGGWVVRKGVPTPNGYTWSTVDNTYSGSTAPHSMYVRPAKAAGQLDEVFVAGQGTYTYSTGKKTTTTRSIWSVRHSADGGATWTTIDSYDPGVSGQAKSITVGADGTIWVAGVATSLVNNTNQSAWLVRKSSNGGATWTNADRVINGVPTYCCGVNVDVFGRIFVVGATSGWTVRGSTDGGATWITTDIFLPPGYISSSAYSVASDSLGNVFVTGFVANSNVTSSDVAAIRLLPAP